MRRFELKGITWNHSRALPPLVATAQRFEEMNPNVRISWEKRSLHEFGHAGLGELARQYDLLVVDHPMMGAAAAEGVLVDLRPLLTRGEWMDMAEDSAGPSFTSYIYEDLLLALPIDAATPAASLRSDLLADAGHSAPVNWNELLELSRNGLVRMPGFPADLFLNFMGLCISGGGDTAAGGDSLFDRAIAIKALVALRELAAWMPNEIYEWNPILLYERMASTDEFAYCPFAYTYSNYARAGFAAKRISFADTVVLDGGVPMRTVLGGTGLAISGSCAVPNIALEYSLYVSSRGCQNTLYGVCGGQPARYSAWESDELNRLTDGFFRRLLPNIERSYVRPRYHGYVSLQEEAGLPIGEYLRTGDNAGRAVDHIDELFRASLGRRQRDA